MVEGLRDYENYFRNSDHGSFCLKLNICQYVIHLLIYILGLGSKLANCREPPPAGHQIEVTQLCNELCFGFSGGFKPQPVNRQRTKVTYDIAYRIRKLNGTICRRTDKRFCKRVLAWRLPLGKRNVRRPRLERATICVKRLDKSG